MKDLLVVMRRIATIVSVLSQALSSAAVAQVRTISGPVSCPTCEIVLERVATVGDTAGPGVLTSYLQLYRDSRGRLYVTQETGTPGQILVFDPSGRFMRTIGREGSGPGEYRVPMAMVIAPGDTIHVFDGPNRRHSVLSPSYEVVRSMRMSSGVGFSIWLGPGRWLAAQRRNTLGTVGLPLHILDDTGVVLQSFGAAPPIDPQTTQIIRSIALGLTRGQVRSAEYGRYYIEVWDTTGRRLAAFERSVDWFPRHPAPNDPAFRRYFAKSNIVAMREEAEGKLWVVMKVQTSEADRDPNVRREGGVSIGTYATMVEIIDTRTGRLIASKRFPIELSRGGAWLLGEDMIYGVRETAAGFNVLDVWRLRLKSAR
jgi:hypothetical protein